MSAAASGPARRACTAIGTAYGRWNSSWTRSRAVKKTPPRREGGVAAAVDHGAERFRALPYAASVLHAQSESEVAADRVVALGGRVRKAGHAREIRGEEDPR